MKTKDAIVACLIAILVIVLCAVAFAAQSPRPPRSPVRLHRISGAPVLGMDGSIMSFPVTAEYITITASPSGAVESEEAGSVQFDLMRNGGDMSVVIDQELYYYKEAALLLTAIAMHEQELVAPRALVTRPDRPSLRVPQKK